MRQEQTRREYEIHVRDKTKENKMEYNRKNKISQDTTRKEHKTGKYYRIRQEKTKTQDKPKNNIHVSKTKKDKTV